MYPREVLETSIPIKYLKSPRSFILNCFWRCYLRDTIPKISFISWFHNVINIEKKNNHTRSRITNKQRMITRALSESSFIHHGMAILNFSNGCLFETLSSIGKQGMDRKSDRALRDRDSSGKKDSLSESVDHTLGDRDRPDYFESRQVLKEWSLGTRVNVRNGISKATRPTKEVRKQGTCRTPTFPTKSNARTLSLTMRSVVSKRWPTRPFSLNILGSEEDRNSFGNLLPKVGIYPRHWYSESLDSTWNREWKVLFLFMSGLCEYEPGARIPESE